MNFKSFAKRSGFAVASLLLSGGAAIRAATPASSVVVTNTPAQAVPVTGYVVAVTRPDTEAVQIDLVASFDNTDVAPKGTFAIPAGKQFNLESISAHCSSIFATTPQTFALRLGTGQNRPFSWFSVSGQQFVYPSFGLTMFGSVSLPLRGTFDGTIWVDGLRTANVGSDTSCTVVLLGYYTKIQAQLAP